MRTSMYNAALVDVFHCPKDGSYERSSISVRQLASVLRFTSFGPNSLFVVVALGAYTIEELATSAEVEDKVEVVCSLRTGLQMLFQTYGSNIPRSSHAA